MLRCAVLRLPECRITETISHSFLTHSAHLCGHVKRRPAFDLMAPLSNDFEPSNARSPKPKKKWRALN
jgi:hypothetical protein